MVLPLSPTAFVPCPFRPGPLGSPQGLFPCLDPTAGAHRLFLCLPQCSVPWPGLLPTPGPSGTAPSMAAPHTWPSCPVPCSGPWEGSLPGLPTRFPRLFMTGPYICSSRLGPQPDPRAGPQTVSAPWIPGSHSWALCLVPIAVPTPVPISAPHMGSITGSHRATHAVTGPPPDSVSPCRGDNTHPCSIPIPPRLGAPAPDPIPGAEPPQPKEILPPPPPSFLLRSPCF